MIQVINEHDYKIDIDNVKKAVSDTLEKNNFKEDRDVEIIIVNENEMEDLNKKYYKDKVYIHPVFTFPDNSEEFPFPPGTKKPLGQIAFNYDFTKDKKEIYDLIAHSTLHLLGVHH